MYNITTILNPLLSVVTWRQNYNDNLPIGTGLSGLTNESGLYFQDAHPALTIDNLRSIAPASVKDDTSEFTTWLTDKTKAGISLAVENYLNNMKIFRNMEKPIWENKTLFEGAGRYSETIAPTSSIAGFEFTPRRVNGMKVKLERVGFQGTQNETFTLYLFHSSQKTAIQSTSINYTKAGSMQWFDLTDFELPYFTASADAGGAWYLVYNQSNLTGKAINKSKDFSAEPCTTCGRQEYNNYKLYSQFLDVIPFKAEPNDIELWDISDNVYTYTSNYGLNVMLSIYCDYTQFIIDNRQLFKNVIQKQVAVNLLREIAFNPDARINRNQANFTRGELLYEIDGAANSPRPFGLHHELKQAYKKIELDTQGISKHCLPCTGNKVKYTAI